MEARKESGSFRRGVMSLARKHRPGNFGNGSRCVGGRTLGRIPPQLDSPALRGGPRPSVQRGPQVAWSQRTHPCPPART